MIQKVSVFGAGQMVRRIAQVLAYLRVEVVLFDIAEAQLERALASISKSLERQANNEHLNGAAIPGIMG